MGRHKEDFTLYSRRMKDGRRVWYYQAWDGDRRIPGQSTGLTSKTDARKHCAKLKAEGSSFPRGTSLPPLPCRLCVNGPSPNTGGSGASGGTSARSSHAPMRTSPQSRAGTLMVRCASYTSGYSPTTARSASMRSPQRIVRPCFSLGKRKARRKRPLATGRALSG